MPSFLSRWKLCTDAWLPTIVFKLNDFRTENCCRKIRSAFKLRLDNDSAISINISALIIDNYNKRPFDLLSCVFDKQHRDKISKAMKVLIVSAIPEYLCSFATDYCQSDRRAVSAMVWSPA